MPERRSADADGERAAILALSLADGVGWRRFVALRAAFGSAQAVAAATQRELRAVPGIGAKIAQAIAEVWENDRAAAMISRCRSLGVRTVTFADAGYPERLLQTADPPLVIYVSGDADLGYHWSVAIVGTRRPTLKGVLLARQFAAELAEAGWLVVSGLAIGIDTAAHEGALGVGGNTVAVLPGGLDCVYPPENEGLAARIAARGTLISEAPPGTKAVAGSFPARNRLISGIALGCVVVEAPERSGALITARFAADSNREVFAVPGAPYLAQAAGCNALLRDGVNWAMQSEDIARVLVPIAGEPPPGGREHARHPSGKGGRLTTPNGGLTADDRPGADGGAGLENASQPFCAEAGESPEAGRVFASVRAGAMTLDAVSQDTALAPSEAAVQLSLLELCGKVTVRGGRYYTVERR